MARFDIARRIARTALAGCVAFSLCVPVRLAAAEPGAEGDAGSAPALPEGVEVNGAGQAYASSQVIVVFKDGTSEKRADAVIEGVSSVADEEADDATMSEGLKYTVAEVADGSTVEDAIDELERDPAVEFAQPNFFYRVCAPDAGEAVSASPAGSIAPQVVGTNDPLRYKQWYLSSVNAYSAWDYKKANDEVAVAVLDTGIQMNHVDLKGRIVAPRDFVGNFSDGETVVEDDFSPDDEAGHGTHVAGIIAGEADNGYGIAGVSYNARVMPLKVCFGYDDPYYGTQYGTSSVYLIAAYEYLLGAADSDVNGDGVIGTRAQEYNVRVTNLSLGGLYSAPTNADEEREALKDEAFIGMVERAERVNITTVCAAGNDGVNAKNWPSDWEPCVSVIALTSSDARASFSNYGTDKDISAPGADIFSSVSDAYYASRGGTSIRDGEDHLNYYSNMDGTSMACPVVAGVAALVCAANPKLTSQEVRELLYSTAVDLGDAGWDDEFANGKVDALAAVKAALGNTDSGDSDDSGDSGDSDGKDDDGQDDQGDADDSGDSGDLAEVDPVLLRLSGIASSYQYTGKAIKPVPTIAYGATKLKSGTDFTLTYLNNTNIGTGVVLITLKGNFEGSTAVTFKITKPVAQAVPVSSLKTSGTSVTATWTKAASGKASGYEVRLARDAAMTSGVQVKKAGLSTTSATFTGLAAGTTYYAQVRAYLTVAGKTYWSGWSAAKSVTTAVAKQAVKATATKLSTVKAGKKRFTAKWKTLSKAKASGYQIRYSTHKNMTGAKTKKVAGASSKSVTVKKLKSKKKYYVQVRTYLKANGKTYWSSWSKVKKVKTK